MGNDANDPASDLTRMWMEMAANAMQAWQPFTGPTASPDVFRKVRSDFLQIWSDWCEQMMRSSAFLESQKNALNGNLAVRKQFRNHLRRLHREWQLAGREDIDALMAAIQRSQRRVLNQMEDTFERLETLETKIDALVERLDRFAASGDDGAVAGPSNGAKRKRRHEESRE